MRKYLFSSIALLFTFTPCFSQWYQQYFDGADTSAWNSLFVHLEGDSTNVWQIGPPQKAIFDSAATVPNVIVTDTLLPYPDSNVSSFTVKFPVWTSWGIFGMQWLQKLDLETGHDAGIVEFSTDNGLTWENTFDNPLVYNYYGFLPENKDTLPDGVVAFSGTDSSWRDIWLCLDLSFLSVWVDSAMFRFTLRSDTAENDSMVNTHEGWMIDNMIGHVTLIHTAKEKDIEEYMRVYPTVTNGTIFIEAWKLTQLHYIEQIELVNSTGAVVERFGASPVKFSFNAGRHPDGIYFLRVKTNLKTETFRIVVQKE